MKTRNVYGLGLPIVEKIYETLNNKTGKTTRENTA